MLLKPESPERFDAVVEQLQFLVKQEEHHTITELCADIGRLIFEKAMQGPSDSLVKPCMRLCGSLFLTTIECDSTLSIQSANIHDYVFRHCIDRLESGSSAGIVAGTTIQGSVASQNIPVERILLLSSEMYGSGLVSTAQTFDLLRRAYTSPAPAKAHVAALCVLLEAHGASFNTEPWRTEIVAMLDEAKRGVAQGELDEQLATRVESAGLLFLGTQAQDANSGLDRDDGTEQQPKILQPPPQVAAIVNNASSLHLRPNIDLNPDIPTPDETEIKPEESLLPLINSLIALDDVQANHVDHNHDDHSSSTHELEPGAPTIASTSHSEIGHGAVLPFSQHQDGSVAEAVPEMTPTERLVLVERKLQGLLNTLSTEDFDSTSNQIIASINECEPESDGRTVKQIAKLVVGTAQRNEKDSEVYAQLCRKMAENILPGVEGNSSQPASSQPVTNGRLFFEYLLNWCREGFDRGQDLDEGSAQSLGSSRNERPKRNASATAKSLHIGLIRFVGELSNAGILDESTTHTYVEILFQKAANLGELDVQYLCKLLTTIGPKYDGSAARGRMNYYLDRVHEMLGKDGITSNIYNELWYLVDLREQDWQTLSQAQANQGKKGRKFPSELGHHGSPSTAEGGHLKKRRKRINLERQSESIKDTSTLASV